MSRSPEAALIPTCAKLGVGVVAYSPLSRNLLAGPLTEKPTDWRGSLPRYSEENLAKNIELVKEIEALGKSKDATAAQLSLAWLIHKAKQLGVQVSGWGVLLFA
jgi:aryl-alcohol dehydrogenase-like predicted oxidoreductase